MKTEIYQGQPDKNLYLMRGLPGSGKSTLAASFGGTVFSTDDFFMRNGVYVFDYRQFGMAHRWNQKRACAALANGVPLIIIDNTNTQAREMKPYVLAGIDYIYTISLVEPETPHRFDVKTLAKLNIHNVPLSMLKKMCKRYERDVTLEDILGA
ncbi:ATP-binding protein [Candidatus Woesearchaeota archaeon]|nr:ATP-binding protein [Candidatus Woesearchaeota archaeon]